MSGMEMSEPSSKGRRYRSICGDPPLTSEIGANAEFQRFDQHGHKNSVRVRLPAMGMMLSINREASLHFYTSHEPHEQIAFVVQHVIPLCR